MFRKISLFLILNNFAFGAIEVVRKFDKFRGDFVLRTVQSDPTPPRIKRNTDRRTPTNATQKNNDGTSTDHPGTTTITDTGDEGGNVIVDQTNTVQDQLATLLSEGALDGDDDVPTLLAILSKLEQLDSDDDNPLLKQILDELVKQNESSDEESEVNFQSISFQETSQAVPEDINPLLNVVPTGELPAMRLQIPSITGGHTYAYVDLTDSKYDPFFLVAKIGITAVFVFYSIRLTAWSSAQLLSS